MRRHGARVAFAAATLVAVVGIAGSTASAGPPQVRPDLGIKFPGESLIGNDQYFPGTSQILDASVTVGDTEIVKVKVQNDGSFPGPIVLSGEASDEFVKLRYFAGTTNISGEVKSSDYSTPVLLPGQSVKIRIEATARASNSDCGNSYAIQAEPTFGLLLVDSVFLIVGTHDADPVAGPERATPEAC